MLPSAGDQSGWRGFLTPGAVLWLVLVVRSRWNVDSATALSWRHAVSICLVLVAAMLTVGLAHRMVERLLAAVWLGAWGDTLFRPVLRRRQRLWRAADDAYRAAVSDHRAEDAKAAAGIRVRIALAPPVKALWIADRFAALESRVRAEYGIDLASVWPRLWLVLPEHARVELRSSVESWRASTAWGAWGVLYLLLIPVWWPAAVLGAVTLTWAVRCARDAAERITDLAESACDHYVSDLVQTLLPEAPVERASRHFGMMITALARKGT
jgi:hypothetical protein